MIRFQPGPSLKPDWFEVVAEQPEESRRHGEVEDDVAAGLVLRLEHGDLVLELPEGVQVVERRGHVMEAADQLVPPGLVEFIARVECGCPRSSSCETARWLAGPWRAEQGEVVAQKPVALGRL